MTKNHVSRSGGNPWFWGRSHGELGSGDVQGDIPAVPGTPGQPEGTVLGQSRHRSRAGPPGRTHKATSDNTVIHYCLSSSIYAVGFIILHVKSLGSVYLTVCIPNIIIVVWESGDHAVVGWRVAEWRLCQLLGVCSHKTPRTSLGYGEWQAYIFFFTQLLLYKLLRKSPLGQ